MLFNNIPTVHMHSVLQTNREQNIENVGSNLLGKKKYIEQDWVAFMSQPY